MCKKTDQKNELREWYQSLTMIEVSKKRGDVLEKCKISTSVWCNWLAGRTSIPELAKPIICEIAGKQIFN